MSLLLPARALKALRKRKSTYLVFECPACSTRNNQVEHAGRIVDPTHIELRCHKCLRPVLVGAPVRVERVA